jgi:cellobiose PTS system EIIB component
MNILLVCAGGISTSFLVQNIKKAMKKKDVSGNVTAKPATAVSEVINEVDVVLIAPQALFLKEKIENICSGQKKPCGAIDSALYGRMDGEGVFEYAEKLLNKEAL